MDQGFKRQLMGMMTSGGHRHAEMYDTLRCNTCGENFKKAEALYKRMRREKPELFQRKPIEYKDSPEYLKKKQTLEDRLKRDKLYQKHLWLSAHGTPQEKEREAKRANSGFYEKHSDYQGVKFL